MGKKLTERQELILCEIRKSFVTKGYAPTLRELGDKANIRSLNGVISHLKALEKKGYIIRKQNKSRAIQLVELRNEVTHFFCIENKEITKDEQHSKMLKIHEFRNLMKTCSFLRVIDESFSPFRPGDIILVRVCRRRPKNKLYFCWNQSENDRIPIHLHSEATPLPEKFRTDFYGVCLATLNITYDF